MKKDMATGKAIQCIALHTKRSFGATECSNPIERAAMQKWDHLDLKRPAIKGCISKSASTMGCSSKPPNASNSVLVDAQASRVIAGRSRCSRIFAVTVAGKSLPGPEVVPSGAVAASIKIAMGYGASEVLTGIDETRQADITVSTAGETGRPAARQRKIVAAPGECARCRFA